MAASANFPKIPNNWLDESELIHGKKIFLRILRKPKIETGRVLFVVHGQGEQSDRYEHFPFYLQNVIDAIVMLDLPGHGKSAGIRGHIQNFDRYSEACLVALRDGIEKLKISWGAPLFEVHWFGHSLGGLITLRTLLKVNDLPLKSVTVSAPLLALAFEPPVFKKYLGILIEPFLGALPLTSELDLSHLSQDTSVGQAYRENPLNHGQVTPRFFVCLTREMELLKTPLEKFAYPLLMISPLADKIVSWKAAFRFFERVKMLNGARKDLQTFSNFNHESFNESEKTRAFLCLENWLLKNTAVH
jgi:alpha-beta hydrolase superfamily lysophospholipase